MKKYNYLNDLYFDWCSKNDKKRKELFLEIIFF